MQIQPRSRWHKQR